MIILFMGLNFLSGDDMWSRHEMYSCYFRKHSIFNELSRIQITNPARLYVQFTLSNNEDLLLLVTQLCLTVCNPMNSSPSGSPTMEFSKQEYWSGLPFPSPGNLLNPGVKPRSPALTGRFFTTTPPRKPLKPWEKRTDIYLPRLNL